MKLQNIYPLSRGGWRTTEWQTYDSEWNAVTLIDVNDTVKINSIVSKIKDKMPTVGNKTNVLIDKTSDVPRTKFKEFLTDNGAKKVTLLAKADIVFVRRDTIKYLQNLETKLGEMDNLVNTVNNLEVKIEKMRPKTPEEKLELRSLDSGPFNQKLSDFFDDKMDDMEKSGKNEYVLTTDEVEEYSPSEIKGSFGEYEDEDKDEFM